MWLPHLLAVNSLLQSNPHSAPSQILLAFPTSYPVVVHYENSTSYIVDAFFFYRFNWIMYFINHDVFDGFLRPSSASVVNVVALNNQNYFLRYAWSDHNVEQEDVVFFIEESSGKGNGSQALWKDPEPTPPWTNALIYILDEAQLYYSCYCCGKKSGVLKKVAVAQVSDLIKTFRICHDFSGVTLKVGCIPYEPFFWCE